MIGCCRTPATTSRFCEKHQDLASQVDGESLTSHRVGKDRRRVPRSRMVLKRRKDANKLNATNCRTMKERSPGYVNKCTRSFGFIALVHNCRVICCFSELFRSETLREIINLFIASIDSMVSDVFIRILLHLFSLLAAGRFVPTVVYDDGCHLAAFLRNHVDHDIVRTTAMDILERTPISVDKMHFKNHVGDFCRKNMDPNKNRCELKL